ncbi:MAG: DUF3047 domain-containing protein [Gammaproteobacteria bacterium]|nr:DUF3047 domain-containing protein [Gammaproteobacteria bacterium]
MDRLRSLALSLTLALLTAAPSLPAAAEPQPPPFSRGSLVGWKTETFEGRPQTKYSLVDDGGVQVLHAVCDDSVLGLVWRGRVDLTRTPILSWRWKIQRVYPGADPHTKAGDDFPARVYVALGTAWLPWTLRSLSYTWANGPLASGRHAAGGVPFIPSPYTDRAELLAVRQGAAGVGQWQAESRDVRADLKAVFGDDYDHIDGVAVMTDCDDSHTHGQAWYGDLRFSAAP